jgi:hypothetical protein
MTCTCPTETYVIFVPPALRERDDGAHKRVTETVHRIGCCTEGERE